MLLVFSFFHLEMVVFASQVPEVGVFLYILDIYDYFITKKKSLLVDSTIFRMWGPGPRGESSSPYFPTYPLATQNPRPNLQAAPTTHINLAE